MVTQRCRLAASHIFTSSVCGHNDCRIRWGESWSSGRGLNGLIWEVKRDAYWPLARISHALPYVYINVLGSIILLVMRRARQCISNVYHISNGEPALNLIPKVIFPLTLKRDGKWDPLGKVFEQRWLFMTAYSPGCTEN